MDNTCEKLPSLSNKASVFILCVFVAVYLVTLLIVSLFLFFELLNLVLSLRTPSS